MADETSNGTPTDEEIEEALLGPGDDEDDDWDDDEEDEDLQESTAGYGAGGPPTAPWAPVPTFLAREYQQENPDAAPDFIFPTVYEENRSEKIRDLSTAQSQNWITHRRAAEQGVKELGFEEYDYEEEQGNIQAEKKAGVGVPDMGAGDALARALGIPAGPAAPGGTRPPTPTVPVPPGEPIPGTPERRHDEPEPKRADLSGDARAEFRRAMRQAEEALTAELHGLAAGLRRVRESLTEPTTAERTAALSEQVDRLVVGMEQVVERLSRPPKPPIVHVEPVVVPAPEVRVEVPAPRIVVPRPEVINIPSPPHERKVVSKEVEYDRRGRAVRVIETDDRGDRRRLRVVRDEGGRVSSLEPEE